MKPEQIIELLKKAFVDEWIAYYQYWVGSKVATGPLKDKVVGELLEHANDERRHADAILTRIYQLGGQAVREPSKWADVANCPYKDPTDPSTKNVVEQNIAGEQCAIKSYKNLLQETKDNDMETYSMVKSILKDEIEHENDLREVLAEMPNKQASIPLSTRNISDFLPISKRAQDPVQRTAESILKIINFLLFRVPQKDKARYLQRIRGKIMRIPAGQVSIKRMPQTASIGQSISITKNILSGLNPFFVKKVIDTLANMMVQNPVKHP